MRPSHLHPRVLPLCAEPTSLPVDKLLQLAESMASRQASSSGVPSSYEELLLLLDILHGQGKHQQALQVGRWGADCGYLCMPAGVGGEGGCCVGAAHRVLGLAWPTCVVACFITFWLMWWGGS